LESRSPLKRTSSIQAKAYDRSSKTTLNEEKKRRLEEDPKKAGSGERVKNLGGDFGGHKGTKANSRGVQKGGKNVVTPVFAPALERHVAVGIFTRVHGGGRTDEEGGEVKRGETQFR